jgi:hypothetical protein
MTPIVARRWIARGWLPQPRWTLREIREVRDLGDAVADYADLGRLTAQKRDGRKAVTAAFPASKS